MTTAATTTHDGGEPQHRQCRDMAVDLLVDQGAAPVYDAATDRWHTPPTPADHTTAPPPPDLSWCMGLGGDCLETLWPADTACVWCHTPNPRIAGGAA
jgi:hypothetical protein